MAISYSAGPTSPPLLEETIGENLRRTAARVPDSDAVVVPFQDVRLTYTGFLERAEALAAGLLDAGVEVGTRIGVWSPNRVEWVLVQYATALIGAILVNVNPAYRTSELEYALAHSGCSWLFTADTFKSSDYQEMVAAVRPNLPELGTTVVFGSAEWDDLMSPLGGSRTPALRRLGDTLDPGDPINIQYTSGTTGFPKGATLSHRNILNNGFFVGEGCGYDDDRICVPVPFYHCFGMVLGNLAATTHGAAVVVPAPAFDPEATLRTVERERCTSLYGVPTMFIAELEHPDFDSFDLRSLRTGIMAGAPCPPDVMRRVTSSMHMDEVTICYGMTETSPVSTQTRPDDDLDHRVATVGWVHPHVEIEIVDPERRTPVERGTPGEFCTRGYSVMLGYWNDPERTTETIDGEGWLHSGDLAIMDEDGSVRIVGRMKDMIIRGGENIYPAEIEAFLRTHPDVADVQVVGVPDPRFGEVVMAWIRPRPGTRPDAEDIRGFCRGRIAHFKVPRHVAFVDEFPMTVTGKIQKFRLREMAADHLAATDRPASAIRL